MDEKTVFNELKKIIGEKNIFTDDERLKHYGTDKTNRFKPDPSLIVFPRSVDEVQQIICAANDLGFAIVPSGGRTGLSAGACATHREVVVSMEKMNRIISFDPLERIIRCEAGVITQTIQEAAIARGLYFPLDIASSGSSQIGGNIATNAGGSRVLRYGMMARHIRSLLVVTGSGSLLKLGDGLKKNNAGYDLLRLFAGSEGTLGVICEAEIGLVGLPQSQVALIALDHFEQVLQLFQSGETGLNLLAFEYMSSAAVNAVCSARALKPPFARSCPHYVLVEHDGDKTVFEELIHNFCVVCHLKDCRVANSLSEAGEMRMYRDDISMSIAGLEPLKCDIAVRVSRVAMFRQELIDLTERYPAWELVLFGHIGDGNLHVNFICREPGARHQQQDLEEKLYALVIRHDGTLSAEHGIGLIKKALLAYYRPPETLAIFRQLKAIFDPLGVMNPGKIFD